jgi:NAD(P)-dependent dehydrogenase (short-subunit alcohol dehydrogenase family)
VTAPRPLQDTVAVVTGASRGIGRGIALALGDAGATVYVTGRSVAGEPTTNRLPGTIDDTAADVTSRGGKGIPVRTDHTVDEQVEALFDRVMRESGRLDLLVNNAWGGYEGEDETFDAPFWEQPLWRWDRMLTAGVRSTLVTSYFGVRLMLPRRRGLIATTSLDAGPHDWSLDREGPISVFYETAKTAINRMAFGMAHNLRRYGIASVVLAPGWTRTERVMREHPPRPAQVAETQAVEDVGRVAAALAADPRVLGKTGQVLRVRDLAREYGLEDD